MTDLEKLESVRKDILNLIEVKTNTSEENSEYILGLHKAALIVDEHIISALKRENIWHVKKWTLNMIIWKET